MVIIQGIECLSCRNMVVIAQEGGGYDTGLNSCYYRGRLSGYYRGSLGNWIVQHFGKCRDIKFD